MWWYMHLWTWTGRRHLQVGFKHWHLDRSQITREEEQDEEGEKSVSVDVVAQSRQELQAAFHWNLDLEHANKWCKSGQQVCFASLLP